jgi:hypothetical protein
MYSSGPRLRLMAVCGWAMRVVSLMMESRTGVSFSQASRGMVLRRADSDEREVEKAVEGKADFSNRDSTSAADLALHSG